MGSRGQYENPVHPGYFADPFVWRHGDEWHAIGTGEPEAGGAVAQLDAPAAFPLLRSRDLVSWQPAGFALLPIDATLGRSYWAPEVACAEGRWYLYYSVGHGDRRHHLRVATSESPLGPYLDQGALTDPDEVPFAIDPSPFRDRDGRWYLFHARDLLQPLDAAGRAVRVGTALVVSPLERMTALGAATPIARATCDWQRFAREREMYGARHDWHTLEGPSVLHRAGRYWCLYSGGCWQDESYGVDFLVAEHPLGPWSDAGVETGPRVLRSVPGEVAGPGHCSVFADAAGRDWLAYHTWNAARDRRQLCIDPLEFTAAGPRARGPSRAPRPAPAVAA